MFASPIVLMSTSVAGAALPSQLSSSYSAGRHIGLLARSIFVRLPVTGSDGAQEACDAPPTFPPVVSAVWGWEDVATVRGALVFLLLCTATAAGIFRTGKKRRRDAEAKLRDLAAPTPEEEEKILEAWKPEPIVPASDTSSSVSPTGEGIIIHSILRGTAYVMAEVKGDSPSAPRRILNMASFDFLGIGSGSAHARPLRLPDDDSLSPTGTDPVVRAALSGLRRYGVGSCGPRGFYGTIGPAHLGLESALAGFCGVPDSSLYSDGCSACSSAVTAFAKRGDVVVADEAVCEPLATGTRLSRAAVRTFRHNDMDDLERVLGEIRADDERNGRRSTDQRRFLVLEGIYRATGQVLPLRRAIEIKRKYKYRLILDEAVSYGVMGEHGGGLAEECRFSHLSPDVEISVISLEHALASVGGAVVGDSEVTDHQRLSGAGYCFSASGPPFAALAGEAALRLCHGDSGRAARKALRRNIEAAVRAVGKRLGVLAKVASDSCSPIVYIVLNEAAASKLAKNTSGGGEDSGKAESMLWRIVARRMLVRDGLFMIAVPGKWTWGVGRERDGPCRLPRVSQSMPSSPTFPSIRMSITASQTLEDIKGAIDSLGDVLEESLNSVSGVS